MSPAATAVRRRFAGAREDWPAPTRLAARHEPRLARALRRAWTAARLAVSPDRLAAGAARATEDVGLLLAALNPDGAGQRQVAAARPVLQQAFVGGAALEHEALVRLGVPTRRQVGLDLQAINPEAVRWALDHAAAAVVAPAEVRDILRALVTASQALPLAPDQLVRRIYRLAEAGVLGLDPRRARAVERFEARLRAEDLAEADLVRRVARYADGVRRERAQSIARTECIAALSGGQQALWDQATSRGLLDRTRMGKVWIPAYDELTCAVCEALADTIVGIDEQFDGPDGGIGGPPAHPNCRCAAGLTPLEGD